MKLVMDYNDIEPLVRTYHRKLAATSLQFKRYLYGQINWDVRLIGIKGARGVGKTTLLLQHIKETHHNPDEALYVSLDNLWFDNNRLEDLVEYCYTHGVRHLYLDEVHRYSGWSQLLKNLTDSYPELWIAYTGSAMLAIDNSTADLSRRQTVYTLRGMSFREYLALEGVLDVEPIAFNDLLERHVAYSMDVTARIPVLKHFEEYLQHGYYPYYKEAGEDYLMRVGEVARLVIESDVPSLEPVTTATLHKLKQLLMIIASTVPMEINVNQLTQQLETTRDQCLKMLYLLERAGLLHLLTEKVKDYKHLAGPKKIFLDNTNLMVALNPRNEDGTLREAFFANQVGAQASLTMPRKGDFLVDGKYLFEVGGAGKSFKQIADIPNSYLALADIETGHASRIPLWTFGMMY